MDKKGVVVRKRRRKRREDKTLRKSKSLSGGFIKMMRRKKGEIRMILFNTNFKGIPATPKSIKEMIMNPKGKK